MSMRVQEPYYSFWTCCDNWLVYYLEVQLCREALLCGPWRYVVMAVKAQTCTCGASGLVRYHHHPFFGNGLAKFPMPHPVFGINDLRLGEMPYFGAEYPCLGAVAQLLCNQFSTKVPRHFSHLIP